MVGNKIRPKRPTKSGRNDLGPKPLSPKRPRAETTRYPYFGIFLSKLDKDMMRLFILDEFHVKSFNCIHISFNKLHRRSFYPTHANFKIAKRIDFLIHLIESAKHRNFMHLSGIYQVEQGYKMNMNIKYKKHHIHLLRISFLK